jgi:lipid-binding SYLF domain-containing protein
MRFLTLAVFLLTPLLARDAESEKRLREATAVFSNVHAAPETGIPQELFDNAFCIVVAPALDTPPFTNTSKETKGYLSCRKTGGKEWSSPGVIRIEGGKTDLQVGAFSSDMILLVMTARGTTQLLSGKITLGADATVAAGPVGRVPTDLTDAQAHADVLSWSRLQSLFTGFALDGATLEQNPEDNAKLNGQIEENRDIVTKGLPKEVTTPSAATAFTGLLNKSSTPETTTPK